MDGGADGGSWIRGSPRVAWHWMQVSFHRPTSSWPVIRPTAWGATTNAAILGIHSCRSISQTNGSWWLVTHRMPWARYDYSLRPGWPLERYGIEQQAEIVKHAFWLRNGVRLAGAPDVSAYDLLVRFPGAE